MRAEFIDGILNSTTIFLFVLTQVLAPELFSPKGLYVQSLKKQSFKWSRSLSFFVEFVLSDGGSCANIKVDCSRTGSKYR